MPTKNVVRSTLTANLSNAWTTITITPWEASLFEIWVIATIEQLNVEWKATAREVVSIVWINWDTLTIVRWYENCVMDDTATPKELWNTPQSFTAWAKISVYISRALLNWVQVRLKDYNLPCNISVYNQEMVLTQCIANNCDNWRDALYQEKIKRCYNDCWFWDWSDWDCVIEGNTFLCANRNYNFKNLTICPNVTVRFRWAWTPRINVQRTFCNMWIIDLRGWDYVWAYSKIDCITGCTVSNNYCQTAYNALCLGCGWAWWQGCYCSGCRGCNATWSWWWAWWDWGQGWYCYRSDNTNESYATDWWPWWPADWYNGWNWWYWGEWWGSCYKDYSPSSRPWWWGWGGWWYLTWNWWNWWDAWWVYKWVVWWKWWDGWNGWIFGRWWNWGQWTTTSNSCSWQWDNRGWNGWNGYWWGDGWAAWWGWSWLDWRKSWSGWDWGNWIVCWWNWAWSNAGNGNKQSWKWWCAINNMYGLILHACEYYNTYIQAKWWDWGNWGSAPSSTASWTPRWWYWWNGGCAANGWKVSVVYVKLKQQWNINVAWWTWWKWGYNYTYNCCCSYQPDWANWNAWRSKTCKLF